MSITLDRQQVSLSRTREAVFELASRVAASDPLGALVSRRAALAERRAGGVANGVAPVVAFIVLVAVLALLAAAISIAVLIFCSQKGMNFEWYVHTSWFEVKVACKK